MYVFKSEKNILFARCKGYIMERPLEPNKEDCCNSGCNPCIFDVYEKQLKKYETYLENGKIDIECELDQNGISQLEYTKFVVTNVEPLCNSHYILMFKIKTSSNKKVWWNPGDHFLFKYESENVSCTRAYTPIIIKNKQKECCFSIIIKKYYNGIVSSHLSNLKEGNITLWRGPYGHYKLIPNKYNRIIMIAQGTGMAAFFGIIDQILNNEDDMTRIIMFYCCRCDSILFRDNLYDYQSYWNFKYNVYVSNCSSDLILKYQEPIQFKKLENNDLDILKPYQKEDQFLVCGSLEFNNYYDCYLRQNNGIKDNIVLF